MANIKWTGIEQKKYGLTARWYVSAYYGNDTDVDGVGLYDPSTNVTGHGGPTRPFNTSDRALQEVAGTIVVDSGYYEVSLGISGRQIVGDGIVLITSNNVSIAAGVNTFFLNVTLIQYASSFPGYKDCLIIYSSLSVIGSSTTSDNLINCTLIETDIGSQTRGNTKNNCFASCSGTFQIASALKINNIFINCSNLVISPTIPRTVGAVGDYSIIIGTVKTSTTINGKTTGVTIEDFKADGNYFIKSYSEVDLFGNASGSGASAAQINEIFNNYYSPIYIDDWQNADFTLRPDADDRVKFGGLNGTYIGAKPVGYRFSASDLWNTYIDAGNTSNLEYDSINNAIVLQDGFDVGTYRSVRISMLEAITVDLVAFMANFVYNIEGTAKQGVANQRIDTTVDLQPDNTANQRVVYDYRLQVAPNTVDALSVFKDYELNREPTIDASGNSQLNDLFDDNTEQKQVVQDFIIEFTIRRVIID